MSEPKNSPRNGAEFEAFKTDIEAAERRVAGEIDPGLRAVVVAVLVFVLLASFVLPHTGGASGWESLIYADDAHEAKVALPHRVFTWLALTFGVGFSMLALLTRRWAVAWVALAGSAVASALGMLAVWSRQTAGEGLPGPGIGLIVAWIAVILLTFHWIRVVWSRTAVQMAAEDQRRRAAADNHRTLLETFDSFQTSKAQKPAKTPEPPEPPKPDV